MLIMAQRRADQQRLKRRRVAADTQYEEEAAPLYGIKRFKKPAVGVLCSGCNTKDSSKLRLTREGTTVCFCGAETSTCFRNDYKDTNDTDRSAARADAPSSKAGSSIVSTGIPASAKRKFGIGYAHENATNAGDRLKLSRGNTRKLTAIIETVAKYIVQMAPIDSDIAKKITLDAEAVFHASIEHHERCKKKDCQKALFNKPASVIAAKSFVYTVEQLSIGQGLSGVSRQTVTALQERVQCSPVFNQRDNATQHHTCLAMIASLLNSDNRVVCPDAPLEAACEPTKGVCIRRQDSDVQSSPAMQIRDAISALSVEYGYPHRVRELAMVALQDGDFAASLNANRVVPKESGSMACAYVVLRSIYEATNGAGGSSQELSRMRRVGVDPAEAGTLIARMRAALPNRPAFCEADEDDLY